MEEGQYRDRYNENVFTVLGYTSQGLGHLRVTNALHMSAPGKFDPILYGPDDELATTLHRISSSNRLTRKLLETSQNGIFEDFFGFLYKATLRMGAKAFKDKINFLLALSTVRVDTLIFVSTHFGLAHQLAYFKDELKKKNNIKINLVVVVTDDSPQNIWFVPKANLTIVPSEETKAKLMKYAKSKGFTPDIKVLPYPLGPLITTKLSKKDFDLRLNMAKMTSKEIKIIIPVSGAAVGLGYTDKLTSSLRNTRDSLFKFEIISRRKAFTNNFLKNQANNEDTEVFAFDSDFEVVEQYDQHIAKTTFLFEITKPSEQCFKAIIPPNKTGGVILLLTEPIGKQEKDNLKFLLRNKLIPNKQVQDGLVKKANSGKPPSKTELNLAKNWRGVVLPKDPKLAAKFINWGLRNNIFYNMVKFAKPKIRDNGADVFWEVVKPF